VKQSVAIRDQLREVQHPWMEIKKEMEMEMISRRRGEQVDMQFHHLSSGWHLMTVIGRIHMYQLPGDARLKRRFSSIKPC